MYGAGSLLGGMTRAAGRWRRRRYDAGARDATARRLPRSTSWSWPDEGIGGTVPGCPHRAVHDRRHRPLALRSGRGGPGPHAHHARLGKIKAIAKGIRRPTSRLGGSLEPFAELTVALARGRTFDVVTQVSVRARRAQPATLARGARAARSSPCAPTSSLDSGRRAPSRCARCVRAARRDGLGVARGRDAPVAICAFESEETRFRRVPSRERFRSRVAGRCTAGPPYDRAGLTLEALKLLKAYQRLDIEAIAALRLASSTASSARVAAACRASSSAGVLDDARRVPSGRCPAARRYTTDAIVLSRFDLGEADRVLTLITPEHGKLKAIAKGVRRPTSRLGGSLEPFAELDGRAGPGRTFDVVTQVERRARLARRCATRSRSAADAPGTSPSSPTGSSRSATPPSRSTRCSVGRTSCSTPGWRRARSPAGTRCTSPTSSACGPRWTAASSATGVARGRRAIPLGAAARRRPLRALPRDAAARRRRLALEASSSSRPTSGSTSRRSRACGSTGRPSSARSRPRCATFVGVALEREARSLAVPRRGPDPRRPAGGAAEPTVARAGAGSPRARSRRGGRRSPGARAVGRRLVARTERRLCPTDAPAPPSAASERARDLHERLLGRRPPRRLAPVGPRPPGPRRPRPRRRPAAHRGQRRPPGARRRDAVPRHLNSSATRTGATT